MPLQSRCRDSKRACELLKALSRKLQEKPAPRDSGIRAGRPSRRRTESGPEELGPFKPVHSSRSVQEMPSSRMECARSLLGARTWGSWNAPWVSPENPGQPGPREPGSAHLQRPQRPPPMPPGRQQRHRPDPQPRHCQPSRLACS